jgi:hypothetical protein
MDTALSEVSIEWDKLRDNRDLDVCITFDPKSLHLTQETIDATFKRETALIKLRRLQLQCLAAAFKLLKSSSEQSVNGSSEELLPKLISEIQNLTFPPTSKNYIELNFPIKSRVDLIPGSPHLSTFISALMLANHLAELRRDSRTDDTPALTMMVRYDYYINYIF